MEEVCSTLSSSTIIWVGRDCSGTRTKILKKTSISNNFAGFLTQTWASSECQSTFWAGRGHTEPWSSWMDALTSVECGGSDTRLKALILHACPWRSSYTNVCKWLFSQILPVCYTVLVKVFLFFSLMSSLFIQSCEENSLAAWFSVVGVKGYTVARVD